MEDHRRIGELAKQALAHWGEGRLAESRSAYQEALALTDPAHGAAVDLHSQLASVLSLMGETALADHHFSTAVDLSLRQGERDAGIAMVVLRHFWGNHLLRSARPKEALDVLAPSLDARPDSWLLRFTEAECRLAMGERDEAQAVAELAFEHAPSEEKAQQLKALWAQRAAG